MKTTASLLALLATVSTASAQPREAPEDKSPETATAIAVGGTAASVAMLVGALAVSEDNQGLRSSLAIAGTVGLVVMPSAGHFYGRDQLITAGGVTRVVGLGMMVGGLAFLDAGCQTFVANGCEGQSTEGNSRGVATVMLLGAGAFVGGVIYDIATTPGATRRANESRSVVVPTVTSSAEGTTAGFAVAGSF